MLASAIAASAALAPVATANGGASATPTPAPSPSPAQSPGQTPAGPVADAAPGPATGGAIAVSPVASASANGITISTRTTALLARRATVAGSAPAQLSEVAIEQLDADGSWSEVATAPVASDGAFRAAWRPRTLGAQQLRAVAGGSAATRAAEAPPQVDVTVYRPGVASWYGPESYGDLTACGVRLTKTTIGVAHKTLPCGTQVEFSYKGRTLVAPVIDRGPFIEGRSWDLTLYAHGLLGGDDGLITVGALPQLDAPRLVTRYRAPAIR